MAYPPRRGQVVAHGGSDKCDGGVEVLGVDGDPVLADWGRGQVTENEYVANGTSFGITPIYVFFLFPIRAIIGLLLLEGKQEVEKGRFSGFAYASNP